MLSYIVIRPRSSLGLGGTQPALQQRKYPETPGTSCPQVCPRPATLFPRRPDTAKVDKGKHETFSSSVLSQWLSDQRRAVLVSPVVDDVQENSPQRHVQEFTGTSKLQDGDFSSTSGIESDDESNETGDETDNDSISDQERGNEPPVLFQMQVPDLHLRPETQDGVVALGNSDEMTCIDFSADTIEPPPYEFKCPIPFPFDKLNIHLHAKDKHDWRHPIGVLGPADPSVSAMLDRLIEMERLQIETQEWEVRQLRLYRKRSVSCSNRPPDRRSSNSCNPQPVVGDSSNKMAAADCCQKCHQALWTESWKEARNEQCLRQPREDARLSTAPLIALPQKYCQSCRKGHNMRVKNVNHVVLRRPKSACPTQSRGRLSRKFRDFRPVSAANIVGYSQKSLEKNGLEPVSGVTQSVARSPQPPSKGEAILERCSSSTLTQTSKRIRVRRRSSVRKAKPSPSTAESEQKA